MYTEIEVKNKTLEYFKGDELATNVWMTKYALKDLKNRYYELDPDDMHKRLAKEFARIESKYPNSLSEQEIYEFFKEFKYIVPQGSPMSGIGNPFQVQSISNCFVIPSTEDSYGGILYTDQQQVQIMKRRGGVGHDISNIRPRGLTCENAARTTDGIELFMERYSNSCREVAQGGRRGALMLSISVHHPQILDFIRIKIDLKKVTGSNISIRVTDDFMKAVINDEEYVQQWPIDAKVPEVKRKVKASVIWDEIIKAAHKCAEPGILFWDTAIKRTPSDIYKDFGFGSTSTNPCGEIILSPYDSCRLMLLNLVSYIENAWSKDSFFNKEKFFNHAVIAQRLMDDMIDLELEFVDKILQKIDKDPESDPVKLTERELWENIKKQAIQGRRTGLGVTGVGDAVAMLCTQYGSNKSIEIVEEFYKTLELGSYYSSIVLARERGSFPVYNYELEKDHEFLNQVLNALEEYKPGSLSDYKKYGRRNIANTTTAPAGSVSCLTQTTSGIEPAYKLFYSRRRKIDAQDTKSKVDFIDNLGDKWQEFKVYHHKLQEFLTYKGVKDLSDLKDEENVYFKSTAEEIDWQQKVRLQAAAQKWICHAISNTTNLPKDVSLEVVASVYKLGWETGCKGITVYRDGSRDNVLFSEEDNSKTKENVFEQRDAVKRPEVLNCDIYNVSVKGEKWIVFVGLYDEKPYEVMGGKIKGEEFSQLKSFKSGILKKYSYYSKNIYNFEIEDKNLKIENIVEKIDNPNYAGYTRTISLALRHGVPVKYLVEQMQKDKEADLFSFSKVIARCLKNYIQDGELSSGAKCDNCGSKGNIIYQEGCKTCTACGFGACG